MKDITAIIKTYEREECLDKLLSSLFKYYPTIKVIVADDSRISYEENILAKYGKYDIEYHKLIFDNGVSSGRNFLVNKVKTKYLLLLDDDFVADKHLKLEEGLALLKEKNLDILGGYIRNYKTINNNFDRFLVFWGAFFAYEIKSNYMGTFKKKGDILYVDYITKEFPKYQETDIVLNFFIAKTKSIKESPWDNDLKLQEHTAFFYEAWQNKLKVAFTNKMSIKHMPIQLKTYSAFRFRDYSKIFMEKHNLKKIVASYDDKKRNSVKVLDDKPFNLEILMSTMNLEDINDLDLAKKNISTNLVVINQTSQKRKVKALSNVKVLNYDEKGLSKSRNRALAASTKDVGVIADDDITYDKDFEIGLLSAYKRFPEADIITFNYLKDNKVNGFDKTKKLAFLDILKLNSIQISFRNKSIKNKKIKFNEKFGLGSAYYNQGEETLFLRDCLKAGLKIVHVPLTLVSHPDEATTGEAWSLKTVYSKGALSFELLGNFSFLLFWYFLIFKYKNYSKTMGVVDFARTYREGRKDYKKRI